MEYPSHHARRQLRLFFAYGFKDSPKTPFPLGEQSYAELAGRSTTVSPLQVRANYTMMERGPS
jgi:hypothetical protein